MNEQLSEDKEGDKDVRKQEVEIAYLGFKLKLLEELME